MYHHSKKNPKQNETKNLSTGVYAKNYPMLMKEILEDLGRWRNVLCLWAGVLNIVKMSIPTKLIYSFNAILIKIPARFL